MRLTKFDVLGKPADFAERAAQLTLSRWKWEMLDLIDGNRSLNAVSTVSQLDGDLIVEFGEECVSGELLALVTISQADYLGVRSVIARPETPAVAVTTVDPAFPPAPAPAPVPPAAPAVAGLPPLEASPALTLVPPAAPSPAPAAAPAAKAASLQERVAALKARALTAIQEAAVERAPVAAATPPQPPAPAPAPPPAPSEDELEFSLASSPKAEPAQGADALEFSL